MVALRSRFLGRDSCAKENIADTGGFINCRLRLGITLKICIGDLGFPFWLACAALVIWLRTKTRFGACACDDRKLEPYRLRTTVSLFCGKAPGERNRRCCSRQSLTPLNETARHRGCCHFHAIRRQLGKEVESLTSTSKPQPYGRRA